jgi:spore germination cell wall hydrolase CwlJ-like protein
MEARGEPVKSQIAVAYVTLNRTKDKDRPGSICGVVNQKGQYTWNKNSKIKESSAYNRAKKLSNLVLNKRISNPIGSRKFFNHVSLGKRYTTLYKPIIIKNLIFY